MTLFFLHVGLEIKREFMIGALQERAQRRLPLLVALTGMIVPALVYLLAVAGDARLSAGWAIPTATDIAFALGVLALVGRGLPPGLRLFLLAVAVIDDLGAVALIAIAYARSFDPLAAGAAMAIGGALVLLGQRGVRSLWVYGAGLAGLWFALHGAGLHPTLAGVLTALAIPLGGRGPCLLTRLEHALARPCAYGVLPLFALANAGVRLTGGALGADGAEHVAGAVALALLVGKPLGIGGGVWLCQTIGLGRLPDGIALAQVCGLALLCGIGFTMSLFMADLAFPQAVALADAARLGILGGSLLAAVCGGALLWHASD